MMIDYYIRTNSLARDDRVLKTLDLLQVGGYQPSVYAVVKDVTNVKYMAKQVRLKTRRIPASGLPVKLIRAAEFLFVSLFSYMIRPKGDAVWYANYDFLLLLILAALLRRKIIWDLHEHPEGWLVSSRLGRALFRFLVKRAIVIVCNEPRRDKLQEQIGMVIPKSVILRNYPSRQSISKMKEALDSVASKGGESSFSVGIVGGYFPGRKVKESIAVLDRLHTDLNGKFDIRIVGGNKLSDAPKYISQSGPIDFSELLAGVAELDVSLCFYDCTSINNYLCEPNRFYQSLVLGQAVLTFPHPSLKGEGYPGHFEIADNEFEQKLYSQVKKLVLAGRKSYPYEIGNIEFEGQYEKCIKELQSCLA